MHLLKRKFSVHAGSKNQDDNVRYQNDQGLIRILIELNETFLDFTRLTDAVSGRNIVRVLLRSIIERFFA